MGVIDTEGKVNTHLLLGARSFETSLVFFLACADIFRGWLRSSWVTVLLHCKDMIAGIGSSEIWYGINKSSIGCKIQGGFVQFGYTSTIMWSFCISMYHNTHKGSFLMGFTPNKRL